ncbi:MAG TPA: hypothetical protein VH560_07090, partial [Polyangia bacterium]|nr:hypothetical protein [Polyangia bacterium]
MLRRLARWFGYLVGGLVALVLAGVALAWLSTDHFAAFGGSPDSSRLRGSPEFVGDRFENPEPTHLMAGSTWL